MKRPVISERMFLYWTDRIPWYHPAAERYRHDVCTMVQSRASVRNSCLILILLFLLLQIIILYFIPYYSRYIHGEHVAVGGRAGAYRCGIHTIVYRVVGTAAVFDGHLDPVV